MKGEQITAILRIGKALALLPPIPSIEAAIVHAITAGEERQLLNMAEAVRGIAAIDKGDHARTNVVLELAGALDELAKSLSQS